MKNMLMIGASALAFALAMPDEARAAGECGIPDASADPNVVSCISDPGQYANGITYNQGSYATPAGIKIDLYGTAVVAPSASSTAVSVTGSSGNAALITARNGSRITASGVALQAMTTGAGEANISNSGIVVAAAGGLNAVADLSGGTGLASVTNQAAGSVTLALPAVPGYSYGLRAVGGSGVAVNNGIVTVTGTPTSGGTIYGITGASNAPGGTLALSNAGQITLATGGAASIGIGATGASGTVDIRNTGSIVLSSTGGTLTGLSVANSGAVGAVTITNNGTLSVGADDASSASTVGMRVAAGTSATLVNQRTGATGGFSVTNGQAIGFEVTGVTGAVSITNSGFAARIESGSTASGISVTGGTSGTVEFSDRTIGGTTYAGDLTVISAGPASGVAFSGMTGAVAVDFAGASLSVTGNGASATGVSLSGGTDLSFTTAANATTGNDAAVTVRAGGGTATGVAFSGGSGTQAITIGDSFTVSNSSGSAIGISLSDGTGRTVSLAQGASVSGTGATGITTAGGGTIGITSDGAFHVSGGTGAATGVSLAGGADQTLTFADDVLVTADGGAFGVIGNTTGAFDLTARAGFTVASGSGEVRGVMSAGGTSKSVSFEQGASVSGTLATATGVRLTGGSGAIDVRTGGAFDVSGGALGAVGILLADGAARTIDIGDAFTVSATGAGASGVSVSGGTGGFDFTAGAGYTVTNTGGSVSGLAVSGGGAQSVDFVQGMTITGSTTAIGVQMTNAGGAISLTSGGAFQIAATTSNSTGAYMSGGTSQAASFEDALTVSGRGVAVTGVSSSGSTGTVDIGVAGPLTVTNTSGRSSGIRVSNGTDQTIALGDTVSIQASSGAAAGVVSTGSSGDVGISAQENLIVQSTAGDALGVSVAAGAKGTVTLAAGLDVAGGGNASGVELSGGGALALTASGTVAITGSGGTSSALAMTGGTSQEASFAADVTVEGSGDAIGIGQNGASGAVSLAVAGPLTVTSGTAGATGFSQSGGTAQSARLDDDLKVMANGGTAYGAIVEGSSESSAVAVNAGFTVTNAAGSATGAVIDGTDTTASFAQGLSVAATGGSATGIDGSASGNGSLIVGGALTVAADPATGGTAAGISATAGATQSALVSGPITVSAGGDAVGALLAGGNAVSFSAHDAVSVQSDAGSALGVVVLGNGDETVALAGPLTVAANGGLALGIGAAGFGAGATQVSLEGALGVTNANGSAAGVAIYGGATQSLALDGPVTVNATGEAHGLDLFAATAGASVHLPSTVSVTSATASAFGVSARGGAGLTIDGGGSVSVNAVDAAYGILSDGQTGGQDIALDGVSATSSGGVATGVALAGSGSIDLAISGKVSVHSAVTGGAGVSVLGNGTDAAIDVSLNTVETAGDGTTGVSLVQAGGAGTSGTIVANVASVTTVGAGSVGVSAQASESGAVTLNLGQGPQAAPTGGVSTLGDNAAGVLLTVVDGTGAVVNHGTVATRGAAAAGILATATGSGGIAVESWNLATAGAGSDGITVLTGAGAQTIAAQAVTASGAGSSGIVAQSDTGAITIAAGTVAASGNAIIAASDSGAIAVGSTNASAVHADAIHLTSASGSIAVALADGGSTVSASGAGLSVDTGGSAVIHLGASASSAVLHGATAGLSSHAEAGQTVLLSGTVGADNDLALALTGGATTVLNKGTVNGYVRIAASSLTFTNAGTWNAYGADSTFGADAVLVNSGTLNVYPAATSVRTLKLTGLASLQNYGTISLVNGHVGDVLDLGTTAFVGAGASRVVLEANLGGAAVAGNPALTTDQLTVGAASGVTTIAIKDLSGATAAQFNFTGIRVVNAASATAGAFVLDGGAINKGFAEYRLVQDSAANFNLVSVPTAQAFELVRTGAEVRRYWRRSGDAWAEQMRAYEPHMGLAAWGQVYGGVETNKSRANYAETVLGRPMTFTPNLDVRDSWTGIQAGFDWGRGNWGIGVTGGYLSQDGRFKATGNRIKLDGGNFGLYARYQGADGLFAHALAKVDRYSLKYDLGAAAATPDTNGTTYGVEIEAGYRYTAGGVFIEPAAGLSWSHSKLDGIEAAAGGIGARFDRVESVFGRAGLRIGTETVAGGGWTLKPYVGGDWEGEMNGRPGLLLSSAGTALYYQDRAEGGRARFEAGLDARSRSGLTVFAKIEGLAGARADGIGGRAGIALRW